MNEENNLNENENISNKNKIVKENFKFSEVITIIFITLVLGIIIGYAVTSNFKDSNKSSASLDEFIKSYNNIKENYYKEVKDEELIEGAINGMLQAVGDPYTTYMTEEETDDFNDRMNGSYSGLGVEISTDENGNVLIATVFDDSPAQKANLKVGDIFKKIGDTDLNGKKSSEIADMIKKSKDKNITVTVLRDDKEITVDVTLSEVELKSVTYKTFERNNKKVGYIDIDLFALNTYKQFKNAVEELEKEKVDSLVIDVRSNTGGYLDIVTDMISLFLKKGEVVYQIEEKGKITKELDKTKESRDYNVVVLINAYSASASEILASSLQESYGATVVGVNSYGKGTVQQTTDMNSTGGMYKFTVQKWLTPKGNWINEVGVKPDVEVKLDEKYLDTMKEEDDNQLNKALDEAAK